MSDYKILADKLEMRLDADPDVAEIVLDLFSGARATRVNLDRRGARKLVIWLRELADKDPSVQ